jgi:hypothetical protein
MRIMRLFSMHIRHKLWCLGGILLIAVGTNLHARTFTEINVNLPLAFGGDIAWGDYDNDGDLDILIAGEDSPFHMITEVYRNDGNEIFTDINANLAGVNLCSLAWGDYDNDGDLDILMSGQIAPFVVITAIYRNDGNDTFTNINPSFEGTYACDAAWGDYDNDGDLDYILSGAGASGDITKVFRNEGDGIFTDIQANLIGLYFSAVAWGDYDNDRDLDILLSGKQSADIRISRIYRNDGGDIFTDISAGLFGTSHGSVAWGDYDSDGDLDILQTGIYGTYNSETASKIYRNDGGGVFTDIDAGLLDVAGAANWGDYDNDGDLDILLSGWKNMMGNRAKMYRNDGDGIFVDINDSLMAANDPPLAWGDYDNDGDLDFLLIDKLYRNDGGFTANTPPSSPAGLNATVYEESVVLHWFPAFDTETPSPGLTYNLRLGTTPGGVDIVSPMADAAGCRRIVAKGSVNLVTTWTIKNLPEGTYYWSVQAVDNAYAGSLFALEDSFSNVLTDAGQHSSIPRQYILYQNYPNPFNPNTTIEYDLPRNSIVQLMIYNVLGEKIVTLVDARQPAGHYKVGWNGTNQTGKHVASGVYYYRLHTENFVQIKKMLFVK